MSKSKEIATISSRWQELELYKNEEGTFILRQYFWLEGNLKKGEGREMFDYLLEHHGLEYAVGHGYVCTSVETLQDFEDAMERLEDFDVAYSQLSDTFDEDRYIKEDEAAEVADREK